MRDVWKAFHPGDLVRLKEYCKDRNRLALVVTKSEHGFTQIMFADSMEKVTALTNNLLLVTRGGTCYPVG